ncbi:hypothetical protein GCM10010406_49160 [Streptomyces thermolineatus]|uniref:Uncharacterized protein n=1 Tax=Streptomyces thermolineatus TaxID=44033 RepID=A0ABN3MQR2_9ACTN
MHGYHARELPELGAVTFGVFPGHHCEFSWNESEEEAWGRFNKMLRPTRIDREPVPFLKMRYDNPRTRSRSEGPDRGLTTLPVLLRELGLLQDAPGGYVEWENRHGEVRRAEWDGTWQLQDASGCRHLGPDELKSLAGHSLTGPAAVPAAGR